MAAASCGEGRGGCVENESTKDRLSSLPDEVAHHILNSSTQPHPLEIKDIYRSVQLCVKKMQRTGPVKSDIAF